MDFLAGFGWRKQADWYIYDSSVKPKRLLLYGARPASGGYYFYAGPKAPPLAEPGEDWVAMMNTATFGESLFEVTVKPGEDAALVLVTAYVVWRYGDLK